jgi:hypothetical protein
VLAERAYAASGLALVGAEARHRLVLDVAEGFPRKEARPSSSA